MCGIVGIFNRSRGNPKVSPLVLEAMAEQIIHRGPDEDGLYLDGPIGFAHRRLSIIDIESGQQPFSHEKTKTALVYNGEIFNYIELRDQLISLGHSFLTDSDTEVVLHAYLEYGTEFVQYLNGQFAIALWDSKQQRLILVRDRVGICPLFYSTQNKQVSFASEIKALSPALNSPLTISPTALDQIFTFWTPLGEDTIFEQVREVQPGELLVFTQTTVSQEKYWTWEYDPKNKKDVSQSLLEGELYDLLHDSINIRLRSDVPVGTYLSGGLDSSIITALTHEISPHNLNSFSLSFNEEAFDESAFQYQLAKELGLTHHRCNVSNDHLANRFFASIRHIETPILRAAPVAMGCLSGYAQQQGFKVVLTGEGADEVFGGYDIFKETKVRQFWSKFPDSKSRPLLLKKLYPYLTLPSSGAGEYLKRFFGVMISDPDHPLFSHLPRWMSTSKSKMFFSEDLKDQIGRNALDSALEHFSPMMHNMESFNRAQLIESTLLMPKYLLSSQGDRMLAMNSIEGRFPFLDHRLIELASRIPNSLKMKVLNEKYLLKQSVKNKLPKNIVNRYKQPFRAPDDSLASILSTHEESMEILSSQKLEKYGYFDSKKVCRLIAKARKTPLNNSESQSFMGILTTQLIAKQFT